jgi:hypothetical protein
MKELFEIAVNIKTPLALGGLAAIIFLVLIRSILKNKIAPGSTRKLHFELYKKIINLSFVFAVIATSLGFLGFIATHTDFNLNINRRVQVEPIEVKPIHITIDVNVRVDKALDDFFGDIDEAAVEEKNQNEQNG